MKRIFLITCFFIGLLGTTEAFAQEEGSPNFSKMDVSPLDVVLFRNENKEPVARVLYSRPQVKNRKIFGETVPYGEVWRTGANEATEVTLYTDMMVGNKTIDAGTYTLYTIPEENEWTVILNKSTNIWGAYDYHVEDDLVRIKVPVRKSATNIEALSMAFEPSEDGADLLIGWADRYVEVPFKNPKS